MTDPPYPREFLPLWDELGKVAMRVLKPTGGLLTMVPHYYLHEILNRVASAGLTYYWMTALIYGSSSGKAMNFPRKMLTAWKPFVIFAKDVKLCTHVTSCDCFYDNHPQKRTDHKWQQALTVFIHAVRRIVPPGSLVYDPFLGSGTTTLACDRLKFPFIGSDIDPACLTTTRRRRRDASHTITRFF